MIGSRVGPYTILSELGTGGMGSVYLAEGDGRKVAIKVVHPHLIASPGFFKRFLREAELGKQVRHENVVRTLDVDATQVDGSVVHYMVMEYVEGKSLRGLLHDLGTIPEALLRGIASQATRGLAAIHEKDIVHRDLKPENILITGDHEVRIMDLGVAKLQEASIAITKEGQFTGSLPYAAPEQFKKDDVGPAADLYSLGVVLYELATGQNPFRADDAASVIAAHLNETPPPAHERNPELSPFLSEVLATLLAKQPVQRFASAAALAEVLEEAEESEWWAAHEPVVAAGLPRIRVNRETALHGRDKDLALLRELLEGAAAGHGSTVWIEGEAGIGKTRLVDELVRGAHGVHVLYGSYPPSGGLGGFSEGILGKFGEAKLADALAPYLTVTPSLVPAFAALVQHEAPPTGAEPVHGEALEAVAVHLMRALAAEQPTVWVVDDLHFAPQESRNLVLALARAVEDHRVLLVLTSRPGVDLADFSRLGSFRRLEIGRLSPREVVVLLQDAFRSEVLAEKLGAKIALKSDGVPFFVFEMIRGLKEGQFIRQQDDGTYVQTQVVSEIEVPSAVKDLIGQRMRDLTEDQRAILDAGAVQGLAFDPDLVAAVLDERPIRVLRELAEIERRSGLVRGDGDLVRFDQNQLQEVLYAGLLPKLRREYHAMTAEAHAGDDPVFLAYHHLRGSRPRKALPHLEPALEKLEKSYRSEDLLDLAERALGEAGLLMGKERAEVLLRCAGRLNLLGRRDAQRAALEEAVTLAAGTGDPALHAKARLSMFSLLHAVSDYEAALEESEGARELARAAGDRGLEGKALRGLAAALTALGRYEEAKGRIETCLALAREAGDRSLEAGATGALGIVEGFLGRLAEAEEHQERAGALGREIGERGVEQAAATNLGLVLSELGRLAEAKTALERCRALARDMGYRKGEAAAAGNLGIVANRLGRPAEARVHYERHLALAREIGNRSSEGIALVNLGPLLARLGRTDDARATLEESLRILREVGARMPEGYALEGLGLLREQAGDLEGAEGLLEESLAARREISYSIGIATTLVALGRVEAARGNGERARALLDEALALAGTCRPATIVAAAVERARLPGGDPAAAQEALRQHGERMPHAERMEALFRLWQVAGDRADLEEALRLLADMRNHAPEECRESMITNVPLHREILEACGDR